MRYLVGFLATIGLLALLISAGAVIGLSWVVDEWAAAPELPDAIILRAAPRGSLTEVSETSPIAGLLPEGSALSLFTMVTTLDAASRDDRVKGLVMDLSGSELDLAESQELRAAVLRFRGTGRFTHAFADSFEGDRASAAYYLATAFERLHLQPSGLLDVRGIAITTPLLRGLLDEYKIRPEIETRHEFKGAAVPMTEASLPEPIRANFQRTVASLFSQLIGGIATARDLSSTTVRTLIDEAPLLAREARDNHLIDILGYWDELVGQLGTAAPDAELVDLGHYANALEPVEAAARIAVIAADGEIVRGEGDKFGAHDGAAAGRLVRAIREAREDDAVKALLLRVNSPGGSYTASDTILRELRKTRADGIPVVVSMGRLAASGGYFISMAANHIVAQPTSITGSIGVLGGKISVGALLASHGIDSAAISAGANATMYSPLQPFTERQRDRLRAVLDGVYADFTAKVARHRRLSPSELDAAARGRIWTGVDALRIGLVDVLGGFDEAISLARESAALEIDEPIELTVFPREPGPLGRLLDFIQRDGYFASTAALSDLSRVVGYAGQVARAIPTVGMADRIMLLAPAFQVR